MPTPTFTNKRSLTPREAANYIGLSESYLQQVRLHGPVGNRTPGPRFVRIGRRVRYLVEDLDGWLEQHRVEREAAG